MTVFIISIAVAMGVSFLCSIMEAALLSLNPGKLAVLARDYPVTGKICRKFKDNLERPIAVILLLNTAAHTSGASVAGAEFDKLFGSDKIWLFSLIFTILMVQYTEILPKTLGVRFNTLVLRITAPTLDKLSTLLAPLIRLVHFSDRPFEAKEPAPDAAGTEALEELDALASMARQEEQIAPAQEIAIQKIPDLSEQPVSNLMIPRDKMVCLHMKMSKQEVLEVIRTHMHARYPVLKDPADPDQFAGTLDIRQMLFCKDENWQSLLRPIYFLEKIKTPLHIAENLRVLDSKLLLVKEESGRVCGMLTSHDLLDELFPVNAAPGKSVSGAQPDPETVQVSAV